MSFKLSREWATPLTMGSFALMAVTGLLMFFHWDMGLNKLAHEWLGWVMVIGVGLHAAANWLGFKRHVLSNRTGQITMAVCMVVLAASFFSLPGGKAKAPSPPVMAMRAVLNAPLTRVSALTGRPVEAVLASLREAGVSIDNANQSIASVTAGDRDRESAALRVLFAAAPTPPTQP